MAPGPLNGKEAPGDEFFLPTLFCLHFFLYLTRLYKVLIRFFICIFSVSVYNRDGNIESPR